MLAVIATLRVSEGKQGQFEAAFADATVGVRADEPGNRLYELVKSRTEPRTYRVLELYDDDAAFTAHQATAHFQVLISEIGGLLTAPPEMELFDGV